MDTRSKSTDTFRGVVSWLCLMAVLCAVTMAAAFLACLALQPLWRARLASVLAQLRRFTTVIAASSDPQIYNVLLPALCVVALFIAAMVLVFVFRPDRRAFEAAVARGLGKIWVELKLLTLGLLAILFFALLSQFGPLPGCCLPVLALYFLCLDVGHNKRFFSHNVIHSILKRANDAKNLPGFERRSLRRVYSCVAVIFGVAVLTALLLIGLNDVVTSHPLLLFGIVGVGATGVVGTIYWYILALKQDLKDWNALLAQIAEMYGGNLNAVNHVPPASNLYHSAMQLNSIRTGIQKAVDEGVRADRTKVELITNVSHDIKTPLTSIISYVELLKKEPDLPPHVMDYVNTISRKADRLSHIVQDVFEVSKAATGNISLDLEDLDVGKLLQQTFAEMEETVENSGLIWRVEIPETPILIRADGQRLYRVFQNLIRNCAQYSLEGSRVYVQLSAQNATAQVSIRNVSKNEIALEGEELTARFVRGDQNRTTEGSGLGLSIAKSFTEACGGRFAVRTDGDLFLVTVQFPQVKKEGGQ